MKKVNKDAAYPIYSLSLFFVKDFYTQFSSYAVDGSNLKLKLKSTLTTERIKK